VKPWNNTGMGRAFDPFKIVRRIAVADKPEPLKRTVVKRCPDCSIGIPNNKKRCYACADIAQRETNQRAYRKRYKQRKEAKEHMISCSMPNQE
jgi:hypothetical protein